MSMYHVPGLTAHRVRQTWRTELFANSYPSEVAFVFAKDGIDLFAQPGEGWHPSAKEKIRPPPLRFRNREHVPKAREQIAKLRSFVPRGDSRTVHRLKAMIAFLTVEAWAAPDIYRNLCLDSADVIALGLQRSSELAAVLVRPSRNPVAYR